MPAAASDMCEVSVKCTAVNITPQDHPDLAGRLNNLGDMFSDRYYRTGKMDDLEEAIQKAQRAIDITPEDHPNLAAWLNNLANRLSARYNKMHEKKDRFTCTDSYIKAYNCSSAKPLTRVQAAREAIKLLVEDEDFPKAVSLADRALSLLPLVCGRSLSREDQQHAITQTAGLAAEACSVLLKTAGDPVRGVEYLEEGRGLIIGYLIDGRSDISDMTEKYPIEAKEFDRLRYKASAPTSLESPPEIRRQLSRERDEAANDLERHLKHIRTLLEFDRFLLSPSSDNLKHYAVEGPIVIVNVTSISSDALIISPSGAKHVPLPDFPALDVGQYRPWALTRSSSRFIKKEGGGSQGQDAEFRQFLSRLWSDCVCLVLDELGFLQPVCDEELPRIWWIGTGLASGLPFHAAGDHSEGSAENTFSCAISSYTPSIKTLRYARDHAAVKPCTQLLLLVTMSRTPAVHDLPGVEAEAKAIQDTVSEPHVLQSLSQPSAKLALQRMKDCSVVHFACHGSSDMTDPSNSYLALQGESDLFPDPLTVQKISESHLGQAWLAYLSACSTAENQVSDLADEALHLASGFQVAGFGHTVASMWPSHDDTCVHVASIFYRELLINGGLQKGNRGVAAALHSAVADIRRRHLEQPYSWAQYVHFGA
ncbi:uncharacterized protein CDV56_105798 [Aspergillus thermomutatus]|uniref:CHAT domain-containing protein n=1 Tax=Aspergillus thermomutatus TaxID=41047 RepID=A0A397GD56_ASPTH|nr:uncharacterized protein CDV56_105798 [Aspergillus thermomutatus]RHZ48891.1 hypothetical protein CDV56_105798 [Aspergillus thermomutatus]